MKSNGQLFQLEAFEPRILLSADPSLETVAAAEVTAVAALEDSDRDLGTFSCAQLFHRLDPAGSLFEFSGEGESERTAGSSPRCCSLSRPDQGQSLLSKPFGTTDHMSLPINSTRCDRIGAD